LSKKRRNMQLGSLAIVVGTVLLEMVCGVPYATTRYGKLQGFNYEMKTGTEAKVFLGIPYALPPTGDLRYEPTRSIRPWKGTEKMKTFGPSCFPHDKNALTRDLQYSEICLSLNVMAPLRKSVEEDGYPVIVYIHGGGFEIGSSASFDYKNLCDTFVSRGIVFVTFNYRVGFLGFLTTGDNAMPGNAGLWDQVQALTYIKENIAAFGGDPERITIMGHSAGGASVGALSLSPHSNYLFQQTISLSGSPFNEFARSETTVDDSLDLIRAVGCHKEHSKLSKECMKQKSIVELFNGVDKIGPGRAIESGIKFHPHFDESFFPKPLEQLLKEAPHKPSLVGVTNSEAAIYVFFESKIMWHMDISPSKASTFSANDLIEYIKEKIAPEEEFGSAAKQFQRQLIEFFVERDVPSNAGREFYLSRAVDLVSDIVFNMGIYYEVTSKAAQKWPTYFFVQDYHHTDPKLPYQGILQSSFRIRPFQSH
uniref:Carboxylic ester hydrolase n=1 Tax=Anisakis simplex TaxID=6269 RepID=A0A0M3K5S0_ANISI